MLKRHLKDFVCFAISLQSLLVVTDIREEPGLCLVTTFNRTQVPTPKDLKKLIDKGTVSSVVACLNRVLP